MGNCTSDASPSSTCGGAYEGFLQPFIINFYLWYASIGKQGNCVMFGLWGLFFGNDDGVLINQCMNTGLVGAKATYYS